MKRLNNVVANSSSFAYGAGGPDRRSRSDGLSSEPELLVADRSRLLAFLRDLFLLDLDFVEWGSIVTGPLATPRQGAAVISTACGLAEVEA